MVFGRAARPRTPDAALPFLDVDEADALRELVAQALRDHGHEPVVQPDQVLDEVGRGFGLWNVATQCRDERRRRWPQLVSRHVAGALASLDGPPPLEGTSREVALRQVHLRLYDTDSLQGLAPAHAQQLVPGISIVLALDLPTTVAVLRDEDVAALGDLDELMAAGRRNLLTVLGPTHHEQVTARQGTRLDLLAGESFFTASLALLLPEVIEHIDPGAAPADLGVLVAVPTRNKLALHVVRDATAVVAVEVLAQFAGSGYATEPGPLSPHVHWCSGSGEWEQVSHLDDGRLSVDVGPAFGEALSEAVSRSA